MIRIIRPADIPPQLRNQGAPANAAAVSRHIYAHPELKRVLVHSHRGKCCCEQKIQVDGDVEHFRPKSHYYWLAYDWTNLLWACSPCNSRYKRTHFPLEDESHRGTQLEKALLINPALEDPEEFISWRGPVPGSTAKHKLRSETTLEILKLRERGLVDIRRQRLAILVGLIQGLRVARKKNYAEFIDSFTQEIRRFQDILKFRKSRFSPCSRTRFCRSQKFNRARKN